MAKRTPKPAASKPAFVNPIPGRTRPLKANFIDAVRRLEATIGLPIVLLIQDGETVFDTLGTETASALYSLRGNGLTRGQKVALLIDSFGGDARSAFEIATLLRQYCGGFNAIIPRHAKSAATLLVLGAEKLIMAEFGELGPLDMQMDVPDREERLSVLDEAQSLERLNAIAMNAMDELMMFFLSRTRMKVGTILPHIHELISGMMRPLFESVDVVRFTQMSRLLKVAEEYARRLLVPQFPHQVANQIARSLAEKYPEHGFIIYRDEANDIGLKTETPTDEQEDIFLQIIPELSGMTAIGTIHEV